MISLNFANFFILANVFLGVGVPWCHAGPFLGKELAGLTIILPELFIALWQHFCSNRYIYDVTACSCMWKMDISGKPNWRGRPSTFDLLGKTSLDQLIFQLKILFAFFITIYLDEEVNCIGYFPSISVPW